MFRFGRDEDDGDGGGDHTVMFRFGEVHLVVKKSTGQRFAAKTIQARCLSSNHWPMSKSMKMSFFEHFDCHPERSIVRARKRNAQF